MGVSGGCFGHAAVVEACEVACSIWLGRHFHLPNMARQFTDQITVLCGAVSMLANQSDPLVSDGDATLQYHLSDSCIADSSGKCEAHVTLPVVKCIDYSCCLSARRYCCTAVSCRGLDWDLSGF